MTKKEIVKQISDELGLTQLKTKEIVQKLFDSIIDTLVHDEKHRIELRNFGVFEVKKRAARKARNPRTGDDVPVEAKYVVTFKPGKEMEQKVKDLMAREANDPSLAQLVSEDSASDSDAGITNNSSSASNTYQSTPLHTPTNNVPSYPPANENTTQQNLPTSGDNQSPTSQDSTENFYSKNTN